ncbi:hypothetical protein RCL1_003332 [Eukaryota sp. TZLM3-RCL]
MGWTRRRVNNRRVISNEELVSRAARFYVSAAPKIKEYRDKRANVVNLDETTLFLEKDADYTYEEEGLTAVTVLTSGHEKVRVTAVIAARADGEELPPMIIVKGDIDWFGYSRDGTFIKVVMTSKRSWMNSTLFRLLLDFIFPRFLRKKTLLIIDRAPCHISITVTAYLERRSDTLDVLFIPPRLTSEIQFADVCWFRTFKLRLRELFSTYFNSPNVPLTRTGLKARPSDDVIATYMVQAWNSVRNTLIVDSFDSCILNDYDSLHIANSREYGCSKGMKVVNFLKMRIITTC